jgi:hypothetical protein
LLLVGLHRATGWPREDYWASLPRKPRSLPRGLSQVRNTGRIPVDFGVENSPRFPAEIHRVFNPTPGNPLPSGRAPHTLQSRNTHRGSSRGTAGDSRFENKPSDPSIPSIAGDVTTMAATDKDQMIGRQRNTWGHAMGDIKLPAGSTVTQNVRALAGDALARDGYRLGSAVVPRPPTRHLAKNTIR